MKKNLILYFSVYGTAKKVAEEIGRQVEGDVVEIEPAVPYDSNRDNYNALASYTKKEHDENQRPAIKNKINIDDYENIFIGYPMWWYRMPMVLETFFDTYDFSGVTIIPFNTHEGSRDGGTYNMIRDREPDATVLDGVAIRGEDAGKDSSIEAINTWIDSLDLE